MRRLRVYAAVTVAFLVGAGAASAISSDYVPYRAWAYLSDGDSSYQSYWHYNAFAKDYAGYDTTVTFIDNVSYSWHNTVRNTALQTAAYWGVSDVKKAYCRANVGSFYGHCFVTD